MVAVLIILSGLLGLLLGGSGAWIMKPADQQGGATKVVNKYVCYDGAVKNAKAECPIVKTEDGKQTLECPKCESGNPNDVLYTKCDCTKCINECGITPGMATSTTIAQPVCKPCSSNLDCGQPGYGDTRCNKDKMYRMYNEPVCEESCCQITQTRNDIRSCTENERCDPKTGCIAIEDYEEE